MSAVFEDDGTISRGPCNKEISLITAERDEARKCLKDAMSLVQEVTMVKDVDIDHDKVWKRWVKALGDSEVDKKTCQHEYDSDGGRCIWCGKQGGLDDIDDKPSSYPIYFCDRCHKQHEHRSGSKQCIVCDGKDKEMIKNITIEQAIERLTMALGVYGERIKDPVSISWENGLVLYRKGRMETGGTDHVARKIEEIENIRLQEKEKEKEERHNKDKVKEEVSEHIELYHLLKSIAKRIRTHSKMWSEMKYPPNRQEEHDGYAHILKSIAESIEIEVEDAERP